MVFGVNLIFDLRILIVCNVVGMLLLDGRCKVMDVEVDGYGRVENYVGLFFVKCCVDYVVLNDISENVGYFKVSKIN